MPPPENATCTPSAARSTVGKLASNETPPVKLVRPRNSNRYGTPRPSSSAATLRASESGRATIFDQPKYAPSSSASGPCAISRASGRCRSRSAESGGKPSAAPSSSSRAIVCGASASEIRARLRNQPRSYVRTEAFNTPLASSAAIRALHLRLREHAEHGRQREEHERDRCNREDRDFLHHRPWARIDEVAVRRAPPRVEDGKRERSSRMGQWRSIMSPRCPPTIRGSRSRPPTTRRTWRCRRSRRRRFTSRGQLAPRAALRFAPAARGASQRVRGLRAGDTRTSSPRPAASVRRAVVCARLESPRFLE